MVAKSCVSTRARSCSQLLKVKTSSFTFGSNDVNKERRADPPRRIIIGPANGGVNEAVKMQQGRGVLQNGTRFIEMLRDLSLKATRDPFQCVPSVFFRDLPWAVLSDEQMSNG